MDFFVLITSLHLNSDFLFLSSSSLGKDLLLRSQEESLRLQRRASRHQEKRDKIERHNRRLGELLEKRGRELQARLEHLGEVRRGHILELTTHIFLTQEEKQGSRSVACQPGFLQSGGWRLTLSLAVCIPCKLNTKQNKHQCVPTSLAEQKSVAFRLCLVHFRIVYGEKQKRQISTHILL